jgi:hypothetical protein
MGGRSTATLSPRTTLKMRRVRRPGEQLRISSEAEGSFSDGLSTKVLPHASAGAHIHIDHRREVERRDAGDDAERLPQQ